VESKDLSESWTVTGITEATHCISLSISAVLTFSTTLLRQMTVTVQSKHGKGL